MKRTRISTALSKLVRPLSCCLFVVLLMGCGILDSPRTGGGKTPTVVGEGTESRLRAGDLLQVRLDTGVPVAGQPTQNLDVMVDENGEISLPLVGRIKAEGLTAGELAERIQASYVPRYYVRCTAIVLVAQRFFYVGGEVRNPNRFVWSEDITLLKALNTAGGFTDYSNRRRVELIRDKDKFVFDCEQLQRDPSKDVPVRPGDTILVPRSIF